MNINSIDLEELCEGDQNLYKWCKKMRDDLHFRLLFTNPEKALDDFICIVKNLLQNHESPEKELILQFLYKYKLNAEQRHYLLTDLHNYFTRYFEIHTIVISLLEKEINILRLDLGLMKNKTKDFGFLPLPDTQKNTPSEDQEPQQERNEDDYLTYFSVIEESYKLLKDDVFDTIEYEDYLACFYLNNPPAAIKLKIKPKKQTLFVYFLMSLNNINSMDRVDKFIECNFGIKGYLNKRLDNKNHPSSNRQMKRKIDKIHSMEKKIIEERQ